MLSTQRAEVVELPLLPGVAAFLPLRITLAYHVHSSTKQLYNLVFHSHAHLVATPPLVAIIATLADDRTDVRPGFFNVSETTVITSVIIESRVVDRLQVDCSFRVFFPLELCGRYGV